MPGESLEALLDDAESSGKPTDIEGFKISELIAELDNALNIRSFYAKSNITKRNLRGMLRANSFQAYIFKRFGMRSEVLDELIYTKIHYSLSIDGKGRKEIADMVSKGTMKIEAKSGLDIADRLFGGSGGPR